MEAKNIESKMAHVVELIKVQADQMRYSLFRFSQNPNKYSSQLDNIQHSLTVIRRHEGILRRLTERLNKENTIESI